MKKPTKLATCTTMIFTDGTTSRFAVMRGPMGRKTFNAHKADIIATYDVASLCEYGAMAKAECEMTARHATPDAPAVYWQAKGGAA